MGSIAAKAANTPAAAPAPSTTATLGAAPVLDPLATSPVAELHLQFGADASSEMMASWHTLQPVRNPQVMLGTLDGKLNRIVGATAASYIDAKSGQIVYVYHARLDRLRPDSAYLYGAHHDGVEPVFATFRTAPRGRARFTFTSFGDQAMPTVGKKYKPPGGQRSKICLSLTMISARRQRPTRY